MDSPASAPGSNRKRARVAATTVATTTTAETKTGGPTDTGSTETTGTTGADAGTTTGEPTTTTGEPTTTTSEPTTTTTGEPTTTTGEPTTTTTTGTTTDKGTAPTTSGGRTTDATAGAAKEPHEKPAKQGKGRGEHDSEHPAQASLVVRATSKWDRDIAAWVSLPSGCLATYVQRSEHSSAVHVVCPDAEIDIERQDDAASLTCGSTSCTRCASLDAAVLIPPRGGSFANSRTSCQENGK